MPVKGGPRTLGGWVIVHGGGVRNWWHIQRLLIAWGLTREVLGRVPTMEEVYAWNEEKGIASEATLYRDQVVYRKVFKVPVGDLYEEIRRQKRGAVEDRVMKADAPDWLVA